MADDKKSGDDKQSGGDSFDLQRLRQLIRLMEQYDLSEVKLQGGDQKWYLRRGPRDVPAFAVPPPHPLMGVAPPAPQPAAPAGGPPGEPSAADEGLVAIKSPTVGTFYKSAQPGDPAFVKIGDSVRAETIVCIVEAMKVFNQIPADVSGTIAKVLASDGDAVEFGQPLFQVKPA